MFSAFRHPYAEAYLYRTYDNERCENLPKRLSGVNNVNGLGSPLAHGVRRLGLRVRKVDFLTAGKPSITINIRVRPNPNPTGGGQPYRKESR